MPNLLPENQKQLSQFAEFLLQNKLVPPNHARYVVLWVRRFLEKWAEGSPLSLAERMDQYLLGLQAEQRYDDWQIEQAERSLRLFYHNFQNNTDWQATPEKRLTPGPDGSGSFHPRVWQPIPVAGW